MALRIRKNQADLSSDERKRFAAALNKMKTDGTYDWYVRTHIDSMWTLTSGDMTMWAHMRPAFLPWHRQLCLDFENDLRAADTALRGEPSDLALPYWDWINYRSKKKFLWWGRIWGDNFMGPDGSGSDNRVTDGPFKDWTMAYDSGPDYRPFPAAAATFLQRSLGTGVDTLPTQDHWDSARALTTYDITPFDLNVGSQPPPVPTPVRFAGIASFRNVFEGWVPYYDTATTINPVEPNLHNRVHVWVGGTMSPISSPNDPVFFLHHCNVDRLWAQWWSDNPKRPYLPPDGTANPVDPAGEQGGGMNTGPNETIDLTGHHLHDPMPPWDGRSDPLKGTIPTVTPAQVLNHIALGYAYDTDPPALTAAAKP